MYDPDQVIRMTLDEIEKMKLKERKIGFFSAIDELQKLGLEQWATWLSSAWANYEKNKA